MILGPFRNCTKLLQDLVPVCKGLLFSPEENSASENATQKFYVLKSRRLSDLEQGV